MPTYVNKKGFRIDITSRGISVAIPPKSVSYMFDSESDMCFARSEFFGLTAEGVNKGEAKKQLEKMAAGQLVWSRAQGYDIESGLEQYGFVEKYRLR